MKNIAYTICTTMHDNSPMSAVYLAKIALIERGFFGAGNNPLCRQYVMTS